MKEVPAAIALVGMIYFKPTILCIQDQKQLKGDTH